jgi:TatD DNase family protein
MRHLTAQQFSPQLLSTPMRRRTGMKDAANTLALLARDPSVIAVGEIGLDFHYDFSPRQDQFCAFEEQLELAWQLNLPVILHIREAHPDALAVVKNFGKSLRGVAHCFTGTWDEAKAWLDLGFYIGITGIVTFERKVRECQGSGGKDTFRSLVD